MQSFLKNLEEVLKGYLKETYLPPHRAKTPGWTYHDLVFFSRGAKFLSTAFTEGRSELPKNYFNKKEFRSAYLLYFVLTNAAKVWKCLEQAAPFLKPGPLKILDFGCGPATSSLACSAFFKDHPLDILGIEQNKGIIKDAYALWKKLAPIHHQLKILTRDAIPPGRFDLSIAANFLSELPFQKQIDLSTYALTHSSTFIIIEPALQKTTRQLMALRDRILEKGWAQVLAPCLHQQNCPMLAANKRDWCHFYIDWKCPEVIRHVDRFTGNKHDYLKMAYMIFQSARSTQHAEQATNQWRVVSSPLISKGKKELILCGDCSFLKKITRLDRDKTEQNRDFDHIQRGDVIEWFGGDRIRPQDKPTLLKKF